MMDILEGRSLVAFLYSWLSSDITGREAGERKRTKLRSLQLFYL